MWQRRDALAAAGSEEGLRIQSIVILCVSALSTLGASWIILSYMLFKAVRTFRHQLILGLAISDLIMALNFMSSTASNISGHLIGSPEMYRFCSCNGFLTQWFVVQTDYWVLTIAVCTYFLIGDLKRMSKLVQKYRIVVFCLPPLFSVTWASIGLSLDAYRNIGAWCWFPSDKTRFLVNFVPRWTIIVICLIIYGRLFIVIHKTHKNRRRLSGSADTESCGTSSPDTETPFRKDSQGSSHVLRHSTGNTPGARTSRPSSSSSTVTITPQLKKIAYQMMTYPLIYMLIWAIPTTIRIYQTATNKPAPIAVATVDKSCIVIQGLFDAIIYGYNESSMNAWRSLLGRRRDQDNIPDDDSIA